MFTGAPPTRPGHESLASACQPLRPPAVHRLERHLEHRRDILTIPARHQRGHRPHPKSLLRRRLWATSCGRSRSVTRLIGQQDLAAEKVETGPAVPGRPGSGVGHFHPQPDARPAHRDRVRAGGVLHRVGENLPGQQREFVQRFVQRLPRQWQIPVTDHRQQQPTRLRHGLLPRGERDPAAQRLSLDGDHDHSLVGGPWRGLHVLPARGSGLPEEGRGPTAARAPLGEGSPLGAAWSARLGAGRGRPGAGCSGPATFPCGCAQDFWASAFRAFSAPGLSDTGATPSAWSSSISVAAAFTFSRSLFFS
jgi:hypothetical protein